MEKKQVAPLVQMEPGKSTPEGERPQERSSIWHKLPVIKTIIAERDRWREERERLCYRQMGVALAHPSMLPYPVDMSPLLALGESNLDSAGVLYSKASYDEEPALYHPSNIAQYALAHWNAYLINGENQHKDAFMTQVTWLLAHEVRLSDEVGAWPIPFAVSQYYAPGPWLSALAQGCAISALTRAYQLTCNETFLQVARRAIGAFERDILDGGVRAQVGSDGIFFEEVAVYPAAHILNGYLLALFGLYDYVAMTKDSKVRALIERSVTTLHSLLRRYDTGYWTRYDLLHKRLATWFYHSLHITLLEILGRYSGCEHCTELAARWAKYQHNPFCRLRYLLVSRATSYRETRLTPWLRNHLFGTNSPPVVSSPGRVCLPLPSFPAPGSANAVLATVAQVMDRQWQITYLTHQKGEDTQNQKVITFGGSSAQLGQFPGICLYTLAGWRKLFKLLRQDPGYSLLLPQGGVFSGAFAALLGKLVGIRVVCMDSGEITLLNDAFYRKERYVALRKYTWPHRLFAYLGYLLYWPSCRLQASIAARYADQLLVAGDEVEEVYCQQLKVHSSHIVRYVYAVDFTRFMALDRDARVRLRVGRGIAKDSIVITMINHLIPGKGLSFAIEGIARAVANVAPDIRARIKVLIAGDGPMRAQVEADVKRYNLDFICMFWGEAKPNDVVMLLGMSDIFLYSATRGTAYAMEVLEAMAAGCAVVAARTPISTTHLLADGRGISVMPGNATEIGIALTHLCGDLDLCRHMGQKAREYVTIHHSPQMLKRSLLRASFYAPSIPEQKDF